MPITTTKGVNTSPRVGRSQGGLFGWLFRGCCTSPRFPNQSQSQQQYCRLETTVLMCVGSLFLGQIWISLLCSVWVPFGGLFVVVKSPSWSRTWSAVPWWTKVTASLVVWSSGIGQRREHIGSARVHATEATCNSVRWQHSWSLNVLPFEGLGN